MLKTFNINIFVTSTKTSSTMAGHQDIFIKMVTGEVVNGEKAKFRHFSADYLNRLSCNKCEKYILCSLTITDPSDHTDSIDICLDCASEVADVLKSKVVQKVREDKIREEQIRKAHLGTGLPRHMFGGGRRRFSTARSLSHYYE